MTDDKITVYLSVTGVSEESVFHRVTELLKKMGHSVIDVSAMASFSPALPSFRTSVIDLIRQSNVFVGILGSDGGPTPEQADGVVIETGHRTLEIEYAAARTLGVPRLLYARESLLDSDSWRARFFREVSNEQLFKGFSHDDELLKWLPEDMALLTRQLQEGSAGRVSEISGTDSKVTEQSAEEEGYNEHLEAARDQVARLHEREETLYEFGPFLLDIANRSLVRDGKLLRLQPKAFDVLLVLVENSHRLVTRDELIEEVWGLSVSVTNDVLNFQILQLRKTLGDEAGSPKYIRTIPTQGYQFIARASALRRVVEPGEAINGSLEVPRVPDQSEIGRRLKGGIAAPSPSGAKAPEAERVAPISATASASVGPGPVKPAVPAADPQRVNARRFTEETSRVFAVAEALRVTLDQLVMLRSILLFGLLEAPTGLAGLFLNSLGISREAMLELLGRKLSRSGKRAIDLTVLVDTAERIAKFINLALAQGAFSDNLRIALSAAESVAAEQNEGEIVPDHLFVALMRSLEQEPGWIGWMLGKEKTGWVLKTLADWPNGTFTEESLRDKAIAAGLYSPASASSDAAAKDDLLNFKQSASAMVNIVLKQDTVPPLVVGVYGPWGSGKSTYLELVKKGLLAEYEKVKKATDGTKAVNLLVVEYDAWSYSDAPKLWAGLITKIAKKLDEDLGWWGRIRYLFKTHRAKLVSRVLLGLIPLILAVPAAMLGLLKPLSAGLVSAAAGPIISVVSAWLAQRQAVYSNVRSLASKFDSAPASGVINSIQDEFRDALESWIKQKTGADAADATIEQRVRENNLKIVVFIDELDRCPLERIVDILEAIKLFLAKEIFIVFMAVDTRVASEAIRLHYKDVRNPDLPREYLEKIVQLPLRVPTARGQFLSAYLKNFMPNVKDDEPTDAQANASFDSGSGAPAGAARAVALGGVGTTADRGSVPPGNLTVTWPVEVDATTGSAAKPRPKGFADPSPTFLLPQLPDTKTELKMLATISERFLESNPRKIKRLLNTYRYIKVLAHAQGELVRSVEWEQTMLGWLAFTMTWPSFMAKAIEKVEELEPKNEGVLLRAIGQIHGVDRRPSEADVRAYLPVSGERIKALWELAGNFLIENADPGSVSHGNAQVKVRAKPKVKRSAKPTA